MTITMNAFLISWSWSLMIRRDIFLSQIKQKDLLERFRGQILKRALSGLFCELVFGFSMGRI